MSPNDNRPHIRSHYFINLLERFSNFCRHVLKNVEETPSSSISGFLMNLIFF